MATLYQTCSKTGISWTVQHSYRVSCFKDAIHPLSSSLPSIVSAERWKASKDFIIGATFISLESNGLLTSVNTEHPTTRGLISSHLQAAYTIHQLYELFAKVRDTKAPLMRSPMRLHLPSLVDQTASQIKDAIEVIARQALSEIDRELLYKATHRTGTRQQSLRLNKMDLQSVTARLAKAIIPIVEKLEDTGKLKESSITSQVAKKVAFALPNYSMLNPTSRTQLQDIMKEIYKLGGDNDLITMDSAIHKSFISWLRLADQNLIVSEHDIFDTL